MSDIFKPDRVYRPDEVAALLKISKRTVYRLLECNETIKTVKVAGQLRIEGESLIEYLEKNQINYLE